MKMTYTYLIFYVKDEYLKIVHKYPMFLKLIYNESKNSYYAKQNEEIFEPMIFKKIYLTEYLDKRMDYSYDNRVYSLFNKITEETIHIKINEYSFEVTEENNKNIIFDEISHYSKNFCMIMS